MERYVKLHAINRKVKLAKVLMYGGFGGLGITLVLSFSNPEATNTFFISALISMLLSQYGMILNNRWGKKPRIDEIIDHSLKGLDSKFALFHYELGANHVLISPAGIFALVPSTHDGEITFEDGKWWQTRMVRGRARKKAQNKLPSDANIEVHALARFLQRKLSGNEIPEVQPILVFLHPDAVVKTEHAPILAAHAKKLKPLIRKLGKGLTLEPQQVELLAEHLGFE